MLYPEVQYFVNVGNSFLDLFGTRRGNYTRRCMCMNHQFMPIRRLHLWNIVFIEIVLHSVKERILVLFFFI